MRTKKNNANIEALLDALSAGLSDEELLLTTLQADIAATIAAKRIFSDLSQKELADELQVSQSLVSKWESGETNYTLETLVKLALKLNIEIRSPFVSERPSRHDKGENVIPFPSNQWSTAGSSGSSWRGLSNKLQAYECKEQ